MDLLTKTKTDTEEEILPNDIMEALYGETSAMVMDITANKYGLSMEKEGDLAESTGKVLLGVLHPKDFINDIADKLGVDREVAKKIANDVNQQIFQKVRMSLRKIHHITDQDLVPPPAPRATEEVAKVIVHEAKPIEKVPIPPSPIEPLLKMPAGSPSGIQAGKLPPALRVSPPKEAPKIEIRPLEIRPIKGFEPPKAETKPIQPSAPVSSPQTTQKPITIKERGLEVMPASPDELKKTTPLQTPPYQGGDKGEVKPAPAPKPPAPPAGLPFLEKDGEKKFDGKDAYREKI